LDNFSRKVFLFFGFYRGLKKCLEKPSLGYIDFFKLCAMAISPISVVTFYIPRSINRLEPIFCLIFPKTAPTSLHLRLRWAITTSLSSKFFAFFFRWTRLCYVQLPSLLP